jgi:hypothetical protein
MASFATDSIIIIHTKARKGIHIKPPMPGHAKKVEAEYLADL